jgi:hypothetical protein
MIEAKPTPRSYNHTHAPRKYTADRRRVSIYVPWTYPGEANQDLIALDNRYATLYESRQASWPLDEWAANPLTHLQGIAGNLEILLDSWAPFQKIVEEATGHEVPLFQRVDQTGHPLPLDERVLADVDTLLVFGLDLPRTKQEAAPEELEALRQFLAREGTCLVISPHHDIGRSDNLAERQEEFLHHGITSTPHQQRFGRYTRSLMRGLGVPVVNRWGLRPAVVDGTHDIAPLSIARDLDTRGFLTGVTTFTLHAHLPHYELTTEDTSSVHVLARQPIDMSRPPHPFTRAGNQEFNAFVWLPPSGDRAGDVLVVDATAFSSLSGVSDSLKQFWRNLASGGSAT